MMKIMDTLPSEKHVHTKYDYNFKGFTDLLKLIQKSFSKKEARVYLTYFVALNFGFRNKFKAFKQKEVSLENKSENPNNPLIYSLWLKITAWKG